MQVTGLSNLANPSKKIETSSHSLDLCDVKRSTTRAQKCTCILFCLILYSSPLLATFGGFIRGIVGNTYKIDTFLYYLICGVIAILALPQISRSIKAKHLVCLLGFFCIFFFSMLVPWGDFSLQISLFITIILHCIPTFFIALSIDDFHLLKRYLWVFAYIGLLCILLSTFVLGNYAENGNYSQQYGYQVLPVFLVFAIVLFEKKGWKSKLFVWLGLLSSFIIMLLSGARGPVACAMIAFLLILAFKISSFGKKGLPAILFVLAVILFIFIFYYDILQWVLRLAQNLGFSTRSITRLLDGAFLQDTSRNNITNYALDYAQNHLFWGTGIANDRVLIAHAVGHTSQASGWYPHNFFTELMMQFGGLWGACLGLGFVSLLAKRLFKKEQSGYRSVLLILIGAGFIPLFVSSSYVESTLFYCLFGLLIAGGTPELRKEAGL